MFSLYHGTTYKGVDYSYLIDTILTESQETIDKIYWNFTTKRR